MRALRLMKALKSAQKILCLWKRIREIVLNKMLNKVKGGGKIHLFNFALQICRQRLGPAAAGGDLPTV